METFFSLKKYTYLNLPDLDNYLVNFFLYEIQHFRDLHRGFDRNDGTTTL